MHHSQSDEIKIKSWRQLEKSDIMQRETVIRTTVDFSSKTTEGGRGWNNNFKCFKEMNCQPQILCPVKISTRNDSKIKTFFLRWRKAKRIHQEQNRFLRNTKENFQLKGSSRLKVEQQKWQVSGWIEKTSFFSLKVFKVCTTEKSKNL